MCKTCRNLTRIAHELYNFLFYFLFVFFQYTIAPEKPLKKHHPDAIALENPSKEKGTAGNLK